MNPTFSDDLTPAERLRGVAALVRDQLTTLQAQSGLIGAEAPPFQFLIAVQTDQGMGVLLALPGADFLADIEAVSSLTTPVASEIHAALLDGWSWEPPVREEQETWALAEPEPDARALCDAQAAELAAIDAELNLSGVGCTRYEGDRVVAIRVAAVKAATPRINPDRS